MSADLEFLLRHVYVLIDALLSVRGRFGRARRISGCELIGLAIAEDLGASGPLKALINACGS